jgi:subtilisin-like proprotein convertase family protein
MAAAIHNFFIEQGSSFEIIFEYLDENGLPTPISPNDCVRLRIKDNLNVYRAWRNAKLSASSASLLTSSNESSLANNQIKWTIPSTITKDFIFDTASYSLELVKNNIPSQTTKLATGQISMIRDIFSTECQDLGADFPICKDCGQITATDSEGVAVVTTPPTDPITDPTVTPTPSPSFGSIIPTPAPSSALVEEDLCDVLCRGLDIFAQLYPGQSLDIEDATINQGQIIPSLAFSTITIDNTEIPNNIELFIDTLKHPNPSDLIFILEPPLGRNPVLLSHRNKINNYNPNIGKTFAFSNKALPNRYLFNIANNDPYVNILIPSVNPAFPFPYSSWTFQYNFDHLLDGDPINGEWKLHIIDDDPGDFGTIKGWNMIVTYNPPPYIEE